MEYALLMEFVKWCEDNNYTEWMGYLGKAEKVKKKWCFSQKQIL